MNAAQLAARFNIRGQGQGIFTVTKTPYYLRLREDTTWEVHDTRLWTSKIRELPSENEALHYVAERILRERRPPQ